jgi:hypothetical protein
MVAHLRPGGRPGASCGIKNITQFYVWNMDVSVTTTSGDRSEIPARIFICCQQKNFRPRIYCRHYRVE